MPSNTAASPDAPDGGHSTEWPPPVPPLPPPPPRPDDVVRVEPPPPERPLPPKAAPPDLPVPVVAPAPAAFAALDVPGDIAVTVAPDPVSPRFGKAAAPAPLG